MSLKSNLSESSDAELFDLQKQIGAEIRLRNQKRKEKAIAENLSNEEFEIKYPEYCGPQVLDL